MFSITSFFFFFKVQFSSVQLLSRVWLFATPWITARQASLSITISQSSHKFTSVESVMPSSHLILCHPFTPAPNPSQHQSLFQWINSSFLRLCTPKACSMHLSYLPFEIFSDWEIFTIVISKLPARTRSISLIPALDFLLEVSVGLLQSTHVVQIGCQAVIEVL